MQILKRKQFSSGMVDRRMHGDSGRGFFAHTNGISEVGSKETTTRTVMIKRTQESLLQIDCQENVCNG